MGLHTGVVVVNPSEAAGLVDVPVGETPTFVDQLTTLAPPRAVVMSETTARLVQGAFECEDLGPLPLTSGEASGVAYRVYQESQSPDPLEVSASPSVTPFVGRDAELALLLARWSQAQSGWGQVVLLSGEPGIGKSRLIQELNQHVQQSEAACIVFRCSPQATQTPFYPIIIQMQRLLEWQRDRLSEQTFENLEHVLQAYGLPLEEAAPLLAALLSLPIPPQRYPPLSMSQQRQRQRTQEVLMEWLMAEAERHPVLVVFENLHWADPSTVELIGLFLERVQTLRVMTVLAYRPEFESPWPIRSPFTELVLPRLDTSAITTLVAGLAQGKALPAGVVQHVVERTDGVPLFVEECAKMLLEGEWLEERADHYALISSLPAREIPVTLQGALLARLDRLSPGSEVARLGSVCGREFSRELRELLEGVAFFDEGTVERGLSQLVEAELVYQVGFGSPHQYRFKHALIQEVAYQSQLRRSRQQMHAQIAKVLETQFPETALTQPELIAHHYTEARSYEPAVSYWQRAGEVSIAHSSYAEAIAHLTRGLEALRVLPDTSEHIQREIELQIALGTTLTVTKGHGAPEVGQALNRARKLCEHTGDMAQLFPVLGGLWEFYELSGDLPAAHELGEQLLQLAREAQEPAHLVVAHDVLGDISFWQGEFVESHRHTEQGIALYEPSLHETLIAVYGGYDPGVACHCFAAFSLWYLGCAAQAVQQIEAALRLAQELSHPYSLAYIMLFAAWLQQLRQDWHGALEQVERALVLCTEQEYAFLLAFGTILRGRIRVALGQAADGISGMEQGLAAWRATGSEGWQPAHLGALAEAYGQNGQPAEGLKRVTEGLARVGATGERFYEAELHRLQGELLLSVATPDDGEAEGCFHQALVVARRQQAKWLELRAAMSLARLWQSQDKHQDAYALLAPVYHGFTEGFDTADLQEAKELLTELEG